MSKRVKFALGLIGGLFVILAGVWGIDVALNQNNVPRGATVGGVEIGGMTKADATATLERELGSRSSQPVTVTAEALTATIVPAAAGIEPNWEATVEGIGSDGLNPITRLMSFFRTYEAGVSSDVDQPRFDAELERLATELSPAPVNGGVTLTGGTVNIEPQPLNGQTVDRAQLADALLHNWIDPQGVQVDAQVSEPEVGEDAVKAVAEGDAANAVALPLTVHGRDGVDGIIAPDRMGEVVSFVPEGKALRTEINVDRAREILNEGLGQTEKPKRNATISFDGSVTPSSDGVSIQWEETLAGVEQRIVSANREDHVFEAVYKDEPATFTTEMAQSATFDEVVGEFTTSGYSAASGVNIARVAQMVNGAIVAPGDTFSLNGYTGPRGSAQGFVESGIILNGRADTAVGGGISQFATTLYNAAYFAGMQDVAHTPHSYYISRYPAGREATVFEGAIDLQFKNTSQYPVRILASAGGGSVTVTLMGVKTVQVESINGGRWAYTSPNTVTVTDENCSPSGGAQGFTTSDTRIIRDLAGNEISRETQTTVYDPSPIVRCA
ncbi:VanW family protein [Corynebacterium sp. 35RC1]|nr:VanW family protein [Corynebacterium sp. 35RC1]